VVKRYRKENQDTTESANKIVTQEVEGFRRRLLAERVMPTIVALRERLEELCFQEVEFLRKEFGPFTEDQDQVLNTLASTVRSASQDHWCASCANAGPHRPEPAYDCGKPSVSY